jgi:hypothetical protein
MKKFETMIHFVDFVEKTIEDTCFLQDYLDAYGQQGWQLVSAQMEKVTPRRMRGMLIFQREVIPVATDEGGQWEMA